ncbi:MAG: hypothetical protein ABI346_08745 [Candidatus Baltobacteraceae bacterium]
MRLSTRLGYALCASAAVALLAACSGGSSQMAPTVGGSNNLAPQSRSHHITANMSGLAPKFQHGLNLDGKTNHKPNWITNEAKVLANKNGLLFVANEAASSINIYPKNKSTTKIGSITNGVSGPDGVGVDSLGNVYETNLNSGTVNMYTPPFTGGPATVYSPGGSPVAVAIGTDGSLYTTDYSNSRLTEYPPNSTVASNVCALPGNGEGVALDSANNLYVAFNSATTGTGQVEMFAPGAGCTPTSNLGINVGFAGGVTFDSSGNLLFEDQFVGVEVYPPGSTSPSQTFTGFVDPFSLAFGVLQRRLYVGDAGANSATSLKYPAGTIANVIPGDPSGLTLGVGVDPAAPK